MTVNDYELMASASQKLFGEVARSDAWSGSPFEWIRAVPSATKGRVGKVLVTEWARSVGLFVAGAPEGKGDRWINGHLVQIKMSTLWDAGFYKFQQIRDQDYAYCLCLGISPFQIHAWLLPKNVIKEHVIGHMGQHTGAGASETAWLEVRPGVVHQWMSGYGDTLESVRLTLENIQR
ncbi:hypothetical protein [Paenarthrobacter sp. 22069]|uniref:hypothetical protein n=1 Tax=Paenarthrobacter sp. 22069 TaxID=3453864 RepID=UPI003F84185C